MPPDSPTKTSKEIHVEMYPVPGERPSKSSKRGNDKDGEKVIIDSNLVPRSPTVIRKGDLVKFDFEHAQCQRGPKDGLFYHCACSYSVVILGDFAE